MALRLKAMGQKGYSNGFQLTIQDHALDLPLRWKKPQTIFVNSMADLFHKDVPLEYILQVFEVMKKAHWHTFQVLTKRAERLAELSEHLDWPSNVWMGVSVENQDYVGRVDHLRTTGAEVRFLSVEPLIGPIVDLDLTDIHWVIVGGESGPGARPMEAQWVTRIRDLCAEQKVPFFFKQWGGVRKHLTGRLLEGRTWDDMPQVRHLSSAR
jgi:protein gp37